MKWQSIETAPKDGTDVLLFFPKYKRQVWLGHYDVRESFTHGKLDYRSERWVVTLAVFGAEENPEPTHWMPVPVGPNVEVTDPKGPSGPTR